MTTTHHSHRDFRIHNLWLGVIKQAVADARAPAKTLADSERKREIWSWCQDSEDFIWICRASGQCTETIRDLIKAGLTQTLRGF
jgi:hypothetical protein